MLSVPRSRADAASRPKCGTLTLVKLCYIRWKDAVSEEAAGPVPRPAHAGLVELQEVGFLLDETDEAVVIGMEINQDTEVQPGRWRLHIPKVSIQEIRTVDVEKAFPKRRKK